MYELKCCSLAFCCTENKIDGFESDSYTDSIYWRTIAWASCSSARQGVVWGTGRGSRWSQRTAKGLDFYSLWTSETHSSPYFTIPIWFDITEAGYSFFIEPFLKFQRGKSRQCVACIKNSDASTATTDRLVKQFKNDSGWRETYAWSLYY